MYLRSIILNTQIMQPIESILLTWRNDTVKRLNAENPRRNVSTALYFNKEMKTVVLKWYLYGGNDKEMLTGYEYKDAKGMAGNERICAACDNINLMTD